MAAIDMAAYMAQRRKKRRDVLIAMSGGKCVRCGSIDNLEFDHRDRETRSFRLTGKELDGPWNRIVDELAKCQLLCDVCHLAKTRERKENNKEPWNKGRFMDGEIRPEHGTITGYTNGCRCSWCKTAKYFVRVVRGEVNPGKMFTERVRSCLAQR